jgi:hypothetical protein
MATYLVIHDVDDVDHWANSPKRAEVFGPLGITTRAFWGAPESKQVGLIVEIPDMDAFQKIMGSDVGAEAMRFDGVHPDTLVMLSEA